MADEAARGTELPPRIVFREANDMTNPPDQESWWRDYLLRLTATRPGRPSPEVLAWLRGPSPASTDPKAGTSHHDEWTEPRPLQDREREVLEALFHAGPAEGLTGKELAKKTGTSAREITDRVIRRLKDAGWGIENNRDGAGYFLNPEARRRLEVILAGQNHQGD